MPKTPVNRFQNPYESPTDVSHATMFFVVILLLVGVAAILYYGNSGLFASAPITTTSGPRRELTPRPATATPPPAPLTNATPVPLATPTFAPPGTTSAINPAAATPTAAANATPTPGPTVTPAAPTPTPIRTLFRIANTGGDGVYLRRTPHMADRLVAWPDNTILQAVGERVQSEGMTWEKVRDPQGNVGWVPVQWIVPLQ